MNILLSKIIIPVIFRDKWLIINRIMGSSPKIRSESFSFWVAHSEKIGDWYSSFFCLIISVFGVLFFNSSIREKTYARISWGNLRNVLLMSCLSCVGIISIFRQRKKILIKKIPIKMHHRVFQQKIRKKLKIFHRKILSFSRHDGFS